jgi:hypothetical protein
MQSMVEGKAVPRTSEQQACVPMKHSASILLAGVLTCAAPSHAAGIAFDCDVPADRFSSVSQPVSGPMKIEGSVAVVQPRAGANLPVAGATLASADGKDSVGFQLVMASPRAKDFDVVLNLKRNGRLERGSVTRADTGAPLPFSLVLGHEGNVTLTIAGKSFSTEFMTLPEGKAMAFCSTGQFRFSDLIFGS